MICRDHNGVRRAASARQVTVVGSALHVKVEACHAGLFFASQQGWEDVVCWNWIIVCWFQL